MSECRRQSPMRTEKLFAGALALLCLTLTSRTAFAQTSDIREEIIVGLDGAPSLGDKTAKVTMVEFSDYQCPRSGEYFNWTMSEVVGEYVKAGKLRYVYRDFPLESIHAFALKAAEGTRCAGEQGKFWEMHDRLFRNQSTIGPKMLPLHAQMLRLDVTKFQQCLDSGKYTAKIRESVAEAERAGVQGTPGFILGLTDPNEPIVKGLIYVEGRQPYEVFKKVIEKLLSTP
jgi:protein-disulfide isomerase